MPTRLLEATSVYIMTSNSCSKYFIMVAGVTLYTQDYQSSRYNAALRMDY